MAEVQKTTLSGELSRMFIDQLAMIQEKTRGNLTSEEAKVLSNALSNLQIAYVEVSRELGNARTEPARRGEGVSETAAQDEAPEGEPPPVTAEQGPTPSRIICRGVVLVRAGHPGVAVPVDKGIGTAGAGFSLDRHCSANTVLTRLVGLVRRFERHRL